MTKMPNDASKPGQGAPIDLDEETLAAVREGRAQAHRGKFVSDEDMQAFFERHGVKGHNHHRRPRT